MTQVTFPNSPEFASKELPELSMKSHNDGAKRPTKVSERSKLVAEDVMKDEPKYLTIDGLSDEYFDE